MILHCSSAGSVLIFFYVKFYKGLPITTARPYHILQAILRAQKRLKRQFSREEIEQGKVGPLLIAEDFDIDSYVSILVKTLPVSSGLLNEYNFNSLDKLLTIFISLCIGSPDFVSWFNVLRTQVIGSS